MRGISTNRIPMGKARVLAVNELALKLRGSDRAIHEASDSTSIQRGFSAVVNRMSGDTRHHAARFVRRMLFAIALFTKFERPPVISRTQRGCVKGDGAASDATMIQERVQVQPSRELLDSDD
jgi:hypothetical protein